MDVDDMLAQPFGLLPDLIAAHAAAAPERIAVIDDGAALNWRDFDEAIDRAAAALQRDGIAAGDVVAICAAASNGYATAFFAILRAGATVAPLPPSATAEAIAGMIEDCDARALFLDAAAAALLAPVTPRLPGLRIALDGSNAAVGFAEWLTPPGTRPARVERGPDDAFNIIYSSGTTGRPKGIVQPNSHRWSQLRRAGMYSAESVTMVSTPLYSNTTLVSFLPAMGAGGTVVLMPRFDAQTFLELSQRHRATHAMLVPVQYRRLVDHPDFDRYDLSSYRIKFCTSALFAAELKAEVLARWPGALIEFYGMTEGGGSCALVAHEHPDKLATVGQPMEGHDIRLIDEAGHEVAAGEAGEIVGRSPAMMVGYHNRSADTAAAEWHSPEGERYIRTGDIGRFDADGFLTLIDRRKDLIISGGFNIYPSDLEAVLATHPAVLEAAVFPLPSTDWGETPAAAAVLRPGAAIAADDLRDWANARLGRTQRIAALHLVDALPRSAIGKVLKRELRDRFGPPAAAG